MKTLIISTALMFGCLVGFGQSKSDLMGPAAKNYKPWKDKSPKTTLATKSDASSVSGPEAKNAKVWKKDDVKLVDVKTVGVKPKGPKAKNRKVWEK